MKLMARFKKRLRDTVSQPTEYETCEKLVEMLVDLESQVYFTARDGWDERLPSGWDMYIRIYGRREFSFRAPITADRNRALSMYSSESGITLCLFNGSSKIYVPRDSVLWSAAREFLEELINAAMEHIVEFQNLDARRNAEIERERQDAINEAARLLGLS